MNEYGILNILMVFFSALIVSVYLKAFHNDKKSRTTVCASAWGLYIIFQCWVMASHASHPLLVLIVNILLIFLIYEVSYQVDFKTALFRAGFFYVLWMLVEIATNYMLGKLGNTTVPSSFLVGSIISKLIMYIAVHIFKRLHKKDFSTGISLKYWIRLCFVPVVTIYIIHNTFFLTARNQRNIFFLLTAVFMILVNYIVFDVYDKLGSQLDTEKKNLVYEQQIALCNKQAAERENAYQETRRVRHDLNGYLVDLKASIQSGRFEDAEAKIDNILSHNSLYGDEVSRSGNLVIDSLINYKYSLAQKEWIEMKCYVFVPETLDFDGADLCIILGNLLDNALEAVKNLPAEKGRIELSMSQVKGSLSIVVKNPYEGKILEDRNGQLLTNKPDKKNHGIGLDSVRRAVGRYNGELLTEYGNGMFRATVLLYPRENLHDYS